MNSAGRRPPSDKKWIDEDEKYPTAADKAHEAEVLLAALTIVKITGMELDGKLPVLPSRFAHFLIAPQAELFVVPSTVSNGSDRYEVASVMRMARCDAIIVRIGRDHLGEITVWFDIGLDGPTPVWHREYRLWLREGAPYLVPDDDHGAPVFRLSATPISLCEEALWSSACERAAGVREADALFLKVVRGE